MYSSYSLEYLIGSSYSCNSCPNINYFSKNQEFLSMLGNRFAIYRHIDDNYGFDKENPIVFEAQYSYSVKTAGIYKNQQNYLTTYTASHSFSPEIFLKPSRPKARFVDDNNEVGSIAEEIFKLTMKDRLPANISLDVLPFDEFKLLHSKFGAWSNGILGFSINSGTKQIFVRENHMDALMLVIGHEIGHVLTETLTNCHDEEAKAFAFSLEWAKTIKRHNIANLGPSIKDEPDFQPARNGLHDVAFEFVDFMVKKGRNAIELHNDLARKYASIFGVLYFNSFHPK